MYYADETIAFGSSAEAQYLDRAKFVRNLGILLSQTREGVERCKLDSHDVVTIYFKCGSERRVNVECDSYIAIIRDVVRSV